MLLGPFISTKVKKAFPPRAGTLRPTILGSGERAEAMAATLGPRCREVDILDGRVKSRLGAGV